MALVKSGWLWRQSSLLKRWKKEWYDLWLDGNFVNYTDDSRQNMEQQTPLKHNCVDVKVGQECEDISPPEGSNQGSLLVVQMRDHSKLLLCAESEDDALAWKMTLLDAQTYPVYVYNPYDDDYQTVPLDAHQAVYINHGYGCHGYETSNKIATFRWTSP
ncbi:pleckstrin homology domain-containing family B member 1 [Bombina bombina]|uniref:pleckstrin homology domain-containing family B member 1 n=1 Tax=Bombina bombina TaxID=8345 RepID=UPI00235A720C|nr:pleckstrin homology domain-containing family B member 1 [Bombina bombina]